MPTWDADLYRRFEVERTRPARDLLAQVDLEGAARVVDLGCGPGNSTELMASRFPTAQVTGLDSSEAMLAAAQARLPGIAFQRADIATWSSDEPVDLLFANAALQWVGDHGRLLPHLVRQLSPSGVLAVQMPDNLDEPSHRLMREVADSAPFSDAFIGKRPVRDAILTSDGYYDLLSPMAAVSIWRTTYYHPMADADAIVAWLSGTGLRPFLEALPEALRPDFRAAYTARIDAAYPMRSDGQRLLAFPRLFIVARR